MKEATLPKLAKRILDSELSHQGRMALARQLRANVARAEKQRKLYTYYPDDGPLRRELYPRHLMFFAAGGHHDPSGEEVGGFPCGCQPDCDGSPHDQRLFLAANRIGKTEGAGGFEVTLHLTGRYPDWWIGHRIERATDIWVCGKRNETTRDILQRKLLGPVQHYGRIKGVAGTGLIPGEDIDQHGITWKRGIADFVDTVRVRNRFGGYSSLGFKAYEQGRGAFEGTEKDLIWDDEEPPFDVYIEQRMRLMTTAGHMLLTFTPTEGMSDVVKAFLPGGSVPGAQVF
jgi:phage terminase large subunit-like protein